MSDDNDDQGYVPMLPPGQRKQAASPAPTSTPNGQGYVPMAPPAQRQAAPGGDPGAATPGAPAAAQPGDFSSVAMNEAAMGTIPALRAQAEAARKRLDPLTAASADVAGNFGSPTTALNFVPYVGPELAGGLHEGIKSAVANWTPDQSWPTYLSNVGKDTAAGVAGGLVGHGAGEAVANPELLKLGAGGIGTALAHKLPAWFPGQELMGAAGGYRLANKGADWISEKLASPGAQAAIRSLIQGGTAAARASSPGPLWDQWVSGQ